MKSGDGKGLVTGKIPKKEKKKCMHACMQDEIGKLTGTVRVYLHANANANATATATATLIHFNRGAGPR